ncbi:MAG: chromosomal replication initiator protein DnaA [Clostridiales bacterium]|jgi:chromosomal replication initiator protein|nr:chromosomal replication initiator protein DnaA [Clostridiales bacterium]
MLHKIKKIWDEALPFIKLELTEVSFNTWIKTIEPLTIVENNFYLMVPNDFTKSILESRYMDLLVNALKEVSSTDYSVILVLPNEADKYLNDDKDEGNGSDTDRGALNAKYTFDSFVIGNSNRFAHAACLAVAEAPANAYNPLFIYGGVGLGKTHLMHAIGHFILSQSPQTKVLYVSSEKFTNELITSIQTNKNVEFRNRYRNVDVLLVDDIQFIAGKESTQEEFFHTFNTLHESNKQIIISSDRPPKEIPTLEDRLRSRFEWGLIADIQPPDLETRIAILRKKAEQEQIQVDDDILLFIAQRIQSNIRELEGALIRILAYSTLNNNRLDIDIADEALKDIISNNTPRAITPTLIMEIVSNYYNIRIEDFQSKKRNRAISFPRQVAMYLCRELTDLSLPKIGEEFGGRDHTTVIHAYDKIAADIINDPEVSKTVSQIRKELDEL